MFLSSHCCTSNLAEERNISVQNQTEIITLSSQTPELLNISTSEGLLCSEKLKIVLKASPFSSFQKAIMLGCWIFRFVSIAISKCKFGNMQVFLLPKVFFHVCIIK